MRQRFRRAAFAGVLSVLSALAVTASPAPPPAMAATDPTIVSAVPSAVTPNVNDGIVYAFAQVGSTMVAGGSFTTLSPYDNPSQVLSHPDVAAFAVSSGAISSTFAPSIDGAVYALLPGPAANEVYVGGAFNTVDGVTTKLALLNVTTGQIVPGWAAPTMDDAVNSMVLVDGQLIVAGNFTTVDGAAHKGLVSLNPTTGAVTGYVNLSFTGHHNYGTQCDPTTTTCAKGVVGIRSITANPTGTELVALGNFIHVGSADRSQIAVITLGATQATLDTDWNSAVYTAPCFAGDFDSNVRTVQFSPDGTYFAVTATGASNLSVHDINTDGTYSPCDAVIRFDTSQHGSDVKPVWEDRTGNDTLIGLAVTDGAVYVGGHERWMNNTQGHDSAHEGAVPRPGIGAADPLTGMPLAWNPGRNPRGAGVYVLYATSDGLWEGSDTDYIGNQKYLHRKIAYFPYTAGYTPPSDAAPTLPARLYAAGATSPHAADPDRLTVQDLTADSTSDPSPLTSSVPWGSLHGAFYVDGEVVYGRSNGWLYERSFDGTTFGPASKIDPYDDPVWATVQTGSGQTYRGRPSALQTEMSSITSMFFSNGRLYYTLQGKPHMYYRYFEPDDGAVGATEFVAAGTHSFADVAGAAVAGRRLFFGNRTTGQLDVMPWTGTHAEGHATVLNPTSNWASTGFLILPPAAARTTPQAVFGASCDSASARCTFTATPWTDPSGGPTRYHWFFGDGVTSTGTRTTVQHVYTKTARFTVTLDVTDDAGGSAVATMSVAITTPIKTIRAVGAASTKGALRRVRVLLPKHLRAGDQLVLVVTDRGAGGAPRLPREWRPAGAVSSGGLRSSIFTRRVTTAATSGTRSTLRFRHRTPSETAVSAYAGAARLPIARIADRISTGGRAYSAPTLRGLSEGQWAVWAWSQRSSVAGRWSAPHGSSWRVGATLRGRPSLGALIADSGRSVAGTRASGVARNTEPAQTTVAWSIVLTPAVG